MINSSIIRDLKLKKKKNRFQACRLCYRCLVFRSHSKYYYNYCYYYHCYHYGLCACGTLSTNPSVAGPSRPTHVAQACFCARKMTRREFNRSSPLLLFIIVTRARRHALSLRGRIVLCFRSKQTLYINKHT